MDLKANRGSSKISGVGKSKITSTRQINCRSSVIRPVRKATNELVSSRSSTLCKHFIGDTFAVAVLSTSLKKHSLMKLMEIFKAVVGEMEIVWLDAEIN